MLFAKYPLSEQYSDEIWDIYSIHIIFQFKKLEERDHSKNHGLEGRE
jgi:hypothetical protein